MLNFNPDQTVRFVATQPPKSPKLGPLQQPELAGSWAWPGDDGQVEAASAVVSAAYSSAKTKDEYLDDSALRSNQRSIERHINDDHYVRSISPGSMVLEGTAVHAIVGTGRWGVLSLPDDGTSTSGLFTFERPSEWVKGKLKVTLRYSAPGASIANFRIVLQAFLGKDGINMATVPAILSSIATYPGPAAANTRLSVSVFSTGNVTREFDEISIRVQRTSGHVDDVNVNAFHVYGIRVEHIPAMQEAT